VCALAVLVLAYPNCGKPFVSQTAEQLGLSSAGSGDLAMDLSIEQGKVGFVEIPLSVAVGADGETSVQFTNLASETADRSLTYASTRVLVRAGDTSLQIPVPTSRYPVLATARDFGLRISVDGAVSYSRELRVQVRPSSLVPSLPVALPSVSTDPRRFVGVGGAQLSPLPVYLHLLDGASQVMPSNATICGTFDNDTRCAGGLNAANSTTGVELSLASPTVKLRAQYAITCLRGVDSNLRCMEVTRPSATPVSAFTTTPEVVMNMGAIVDHGVGSGWVHGLLSSGEVKWVRTAPDNYGVNQTVAAAEPLVSIDSSQHHVCGLSSGGNLYCSYNGNRVFRAIAMPASVLALASSSGNTAAGVQAHVCALMSDGSVGCFRENVDTSAVVLDPPFSAVTLVQGLIGVTKIAMGYQFGCAVQSDGGVKCWGSNSDGQLGNNTYVNTDFSAVSVQGLPEPIAELSAAPSGLGMLARGQSGRWYAWGRLGWDRQLP
jgi:hypothetical protein